MCRTHQGLQCRNGLLLCGSPWAHGPSAQLFYIKNLVLSPDTWWSRTVLCIQWWLESNEAPDELWLTNPWQEICFLNVCLSNPNKENKFYQSYGVLYVFSLFRKTAIQCILIIPTHITECFALPDLPHFLCPSLQVLPVYSSFSLLLV